MKKFLLNMLLWTWCLPQTILGELFYLIFKLRKKIISNYKFNRMLGSVVNMKASTITLGRRQFINTLYMIFFQNKFYEWGIKQYIQSQQHSYGHWIQSLIFGPFYLPFIAFPSFIYSLYCKVNWWNVVRFYKFYTEKWADKIGGVER
jgi:hypothetical protein